MVSTENALVDKYAQQTSGLLLQEEKMDDFQQMQQQAPKSEKRDMAEKKTGQNYNKTSTKLRQYTHITPVIV